jgi:hypothetical protein
MSGFTDRAAKVRVLPSGQHRIRVAVSAVMDQVGWRLGRE